MLIYDTLNCPADLLSSRRIGKPSDGKPKLLRFSLRDLKQIQAVLYSASRLKGNNQYKNVSLSPDRTPMEQKEFRKLRKELKEQRANDKSVVIRGLSIVKTKQSNRTFSKSPTVPLLLAMDLNYLICMMLLITNRTLHPIHGIQILLLQWNTYCFIIVIVVVCVTK